jgi:hypothetical protein
MAKRPPVNKGLQPQEVWDEFTKSGENVSATARALGITRASVLHHLRKMPGFGKPKFGGRVKPTVAVKAPSKGEVRRYILTSAQNNTRVPDGLWANLMALKEHYQAELFVSTFTYNKNAYGLKNQKQGTYAPQDEMWYDERLLPHIRDERVQLAEGLVWCGEMNILPTAARPLSELNTYTGTQSGIFPHAKMAMKAVPTGKSEAAKHNYTTGACTMVNYIKRLAGLRAEFHHTYGAILVEVDVDGVWHVRQLNADSKWRIYDLDIVVDGGVVQRHNGVEACIWGDIHAPRTNEKVLASVWQENGVLDNLHPRFQVVHDLLDFHSRNHHDLRDHVKMFKRHAEGLDSIWAELQLAARFLNNAHRDWCRTIVVNSNHDRFLERWIVDADFKRDPKNARLYLRATAAWYEAIEQKDEKFHLLEWAVSAAGLGTAATFLHRDESFLIKGIEHGMHGDEGPHGARGSATSLSNLGRKLNMGHTHQAEIHDGVYVAGTFSELDMDYNHGPQAWSHSFIVVYPNGKRAIVTLKDGRWRVQ